jgi:hypothetical protein
MNVCYRDACYPRNTLASDHETLPSQTLPPLLENTPSAEPKAKGGGKDEQAEDDDDGVCVFIYVHLCELYVDVSCVRVCIHTCTLVCSGVHTHVYTRKHIG